MLENGRIETGLAFAGRSIVRLYVVSPFRLVVLYRYTSLFAVLPYQHVCNLLRGSATA